MIGKTQGFLDGMHQYVPALAKTLRVPHEAPRYYAMIAILQFGLPILLCYAWVMRPSRFGLGVGAILMASAAYHLYSENLVELRERSFFGTLKLDAPRTTIGNSTTTGWCTAPRCTASRKS